MPPCPNSNALLRHQVQPLSIRLLPMHSASARAAPVEPTLLQRFRRFRATVEREYRRWHSVALYAQRLGCSQKSLQRATLAAKPGSRLVRFAPPILSKSEIRMDTRRPTPMR